MFEYLVTNIIPKKVGELDFYLFDLTIYYFITIKVTFLHC